MERIGKYRVIAKLGQGGMARVLLVMPDGMPGFQKLLVVKELKQDLVEDDEFLAMFLDEARLAARLNHPNIVQSYEVGADGDRHYIAMEYLEGQPLNAVLRRVGRPNFSLEIHLKVLVDVLAALEHAHELADFDGSPLNVVHRDVSPQNVFITFDGHVKLVDFGIAKVAGASTTTRQGVIKGKISYIAPEQASGDDIDGRTDLFAVGTMLWEALARQRISRKEDEMTILARRIAGNDPKVRDVAPDVPKTLGEICDKAMALDPADRFQSARDFREALEDYMRVRGWHVGPRDVGRVVAGAFNEEREQIRRIIEERVEADQTQSGPISLDLHPERLLATSQSLPRVRVENTPSGPPKSESSTQLTQAVTTPPPPARKVLPLVAVAVVSIAAGVGLFMVRGGEEQPAPAASNTAPQSETIRLAIHYPEGAHLALDGGRVDGNPFEANVPKDGSVHKITVTKSGFVTDSRTILFDRDHELTVELEAEPEVAVAPPEPEPEDDDDDEAKDKPEPQVVVVRRPKPDPDPEPEAKPPPPPPPPPAGSKPSQPGVKIDREQPLPLMNGSSQRGLMHRVARGALAASLSFAALTAVEAATDSTAVAHAQYDGDAVAGEAESGESAGDHFDAGVGLFRDGDYMAAMIEFKKAYELDPNFHVLYNLGQTSRELRQYADALEWFREYLERGGEKVSESRRTEVEGWIKELEGRVGTITLKVNVEGADVAVDDIAVGTTPLDKPLILSTGRRKIAITKNGYAPLTRYVDVAGKEKKELELELVSLTQPDPKPGDGSSPTPVPVTPEEEGFSALPFVLLGGTVAVGIGAAVVGGLALGAKGDFDDALETVPTTAADVDSARSSARTLAITADVLMGVAGALGAATIIVFIVEGTSGGDADTADAASVRLQAGPTSLGLTGTF